MYARMHVCVGWIGCGNGDLVVVVRTEGLMIIATAFLIYEFRFFPPRRG